MPLSILSQAFDLAQPVTRASDPGWLFAQTVNLVSSTGLIMWRTPLIRDEDGMFAPVLDLMKRSRVEQLVRVIVPDEHMWNGKLECVVALLHPLRGDVPPSAGQRHFVDVFRDWGACVKPCDMVAELASRTLRVLT